MPTVVCRPDGASVCRAVVSDVTQRRQDADTLRETVGELESALAEKAVLLREVHHRVRNNLAVISSLLSMRAETAGSSEAKLALALALMARRLIEERAEKAAADLDGDAAHPDRPEVA